MLLLSFVFSSRYECFKYKNTVNYPLLFLLITYSFVVSIVSHFFECIISTCTLTVFLPVERMLYTGSTESLSLLLEEDKLVFCWENDALARETRNLSIYPTAQNK